MRCIFKKNQLTSWVFATHSLLSLLFSDAIEIEALEFRGGTHQGGILSWFDHFGNTHIFIILRKPQNFVKSSPYFWVLTLCTVVKSKGKISQNFVTISEYMNFNYLLHLKQTFPPIIWIFTEGEGDEIKYISS